ATSGDLERLQSSKSSAAASYVGGHMRKLAIAIGTIIAVVILVAVALAAFFNPNKYRRAIQAELERRLDRKVTLGTMHLGFFPPRFQVENLSISDDPAFNDVKPFVQAQELDVSPKLLPLLHKSVEIDSLNLQRPSVELIKDAQGMWNFSTLGAHPSGGPSPH